MVMASQGIKFRNIIGFYYSGVLVADISMAKRNENPFNSVFKNTVTGLDEKNGYILYIDEDGYKMSGRKEYFCYSYPNRVKGTGKPVFWEKEYWIKENK